MQVAGKRRAEKERAATGRLSLCQRRVAYIALTVTHSTLMGNGMFSARLRVAVHCGCVSALH